MPNIVVVLRDEILRLARKEVRGQTGILRKVSAQYRRDIARMKRQVADLQRKIGSLEKRVSSEGSSREVQADARGVRFTAKGLRSQRRRLGLSAADYGKLVGVTGQTIYSWERGSARPRRQQVAHIASLRGMGKRQVQNRLEQLTRGSGRRAR